MNSDGRCLRQCGAQAEEARSNSCSSGRRARAARPPAASKAARAVLAMSTFDHTYLAVMQQLLAEREEACLRDHSDLIVGIGGHLNLCLALPGISRGVHREDRLGVACVMHLTKAANDYVAALQLVGRSLHSQAANSARAGLETSCQGSWLHVKRTHLDPWWNGSKLATTKDIRRDLPWSEWRDFLYADLSEIAHPRRRSMEFLVVRSPESGKATATSLLPPYDSKAILHTFMSIACCLVTSLWDFEQLHLPAMTDPEKVMWNGAMEPLRAHYDEVVVPFLKALGGKFPEATP